MGRFLPRNGARVYLALALCALLTRAVDATVPTWPTNAEFCSLWARSKVCETWKRWYQWQEDEGRTWDTAASECTDDLFAYGCVASQDQNLCNFVGNTTNGDTEADDLATYEDDLSDYRADFQSTYGCSQHSFDETACQSSTDCFWVANSYGSGGSCKLKSSVANETLTNASAPAVLIAYDFFSYRVSDECEALSSDQTACEDTTGCKYDIFNSECEKIEHRSCGGVHSHSPSELWGIMDACAEDLSTSVTDALLEGYGYWGGMAHLEKAANGLPLWPTNAEFCGVWNDHTLCDSWQSYNHDQADCEALTGCTYTAVGQYGNPECTVSNATSAEAFENYEGELNDYVSQFTSACSQYWDDETACQSSTDCFWITDRGNCRWKSAVANSTLTSSGAPPGIIAYDAVVFGRRHHDECGLHDSDQTQCELTSGCRYSSSRCYGPGECDAHDSNQTQCELTQGCNYNPSRCYTAGYYELWTVLDACGADISDADADNLAREEGYWGGMDHLIGLVQGAPAPPSPSSSGGSGGGTSSLLEGYCAGWEMSLVCDGRLRELGETNCTNLGCDWDSDANACSPPNGVMPPSYIIYVLMMSPLSPIASQVQNCSSADPCGPPDCYDEVDQCGVSDQRLLAGSEMFGLPGTVGRDMVEYELRFSRVCGVRTNVTSCEADAECAWNGTECKASVAYALATAANSCVNTTSPHVNFSSAASALGTTMADAFADSGVVKSTRPCMVIAPANGALGNCTQELQSGETCTPECDSGYVLSGESTCNDGAFVPAVCSPVCTVVAPGNGTLGACPGTLRHNETCTPECDSGYVLSGESTCNDGTFVPAVCLPLCTVVAPANGTLGNCTQELPSGETCTPECNSGYVLSGESTCNDGTFVPAVCLPPCPVVAPANGQLGNCTQELPRGETCTPSCDAGFTLSGSITCDGGGTLQPAFCMPRYFTTAEFCPAWEAQIFCSFSDDAMSCSEQSQCAWDGNAGECIPSGTLLKSALASTEAMMQMALSDESTACSGLSSANCSAADNCTWWSRENSCEVAVSTIQDALTRDDAPITAFAHATLESMERSCNGVVDESECASRPDCEPVRNDTDGSFDFCGMFEPRYLALAAVECVGTTATFASAAANMSTTIHEVQDSVFSFPDGDTFCAAWEANITCASVNVAADCNSTQSCAWNVDDGACEVSDVTPAPTPADPDVVCVTLNETWCESAESCRWNGSSCARYDDAKSTSFSMTLESTDEALDLALDVHTSACASRSTPSTCETDDEECAWRAADQRCEPSESAAARRLAGAGAPRAVIEMFKLEHHRQKVCDVLLNSTSCVDHAECAWDQTESACLTSDEYRVARAVNACADTASGFEEAAIAIGTDVSSIFASVGVSRAPRYPGVLGCQVECEGHGLDEAACDDKPHYCEWSRSRQQCRSAVGAAACPEDSPTSAWIPASHMSGDAWFDETFQESENGIIRVDLNGKEWAYYRRITRVDVFEPYYHIFNNWFSKDNILNVDFELYSTYADALARTKSARWTFCSYDVPGEGFPGGCGPDGPPSVGDVYFDNHLSKNTAEPSGAYERKGCDMTEPGGSPCNTTIVSAEKGHTVYLESPRRLAYGRYFVPALDSNAARFRGGEELASAGDLSLGGAKAFTVRFKAKLDEVSNTTPGVLVVNALSATPLTITGAWDAVQSGELRYRLQIPACGVDCYSGTPAVGAAEVTMTYDGTEANVFVDGVRSVDDTISVCKTNSVPNRCAVPSGSSWKMGSSTGDGYEMTGTMHHLTVWRTALSRQNVRRLAVADYRHVPNPSHHFNFDEGEGSVVRDSALGSDARAHFGPAPAYVRSPAAPSLERRPWDALYLDASAGRVDVADSPRLRKLYEGSFTMQMWFNVRTDPSPGQEALVFGNDRNGTASGSFNLWLTSNLELRLAYQSSALATEEHRFTKPEEILKRDRWYHIAAQRDVGDGVMRVFVDGAAWSALDASADDDHFLGATIDSGLGLTLGPGGAGCEALMADFQAYAFAAPPAFPTGAGVCAPPAVDGLIAWFSLDRTGEQVDASGFDHAAEAFDVAAVNATLPSYDYTRFGGMARTRHGVNGTAPCAAWSLYPGCAAPEPEEDSECLAAAGFDTGECGRKASGGIVSFADGFTIHTFTDVDAHATFAIDRDDLTRVEVLVVGGGGGGGFDKGAGGDGGEVKHRGQRNALEVVKGQTFDVVVGAGGAGGATTNATGGDGGNSSFARSANSILGENHVIVAAGGAGGSSSDGAGGDGAAGAGDSAASDVPGAAGFAAVFPTAGVPAPFAGGGGACHVQYCTTGSATGGDGDATCEDGACDAFPNSGGGGGGVQVDDPRARGGRGADGVVIVRYA